MNIIASCLLLLCGLVGCHASYLPKHSRAVANEMFLGEVMTDSPSQGRSAAMTPASNGGVTGPSEAAGTITEEDIGLTAEPSKVAAGEFVDLTYTADINTFATACTFVFDSLEALDFEELDNCQTVNDFSQPATCRWPGSNTGGLFLFGMLCNSDPTTVVFQIEVSVLAPQLVLFADVDTASTGEQILITASATGSVTDLNGTFISQPLVGRSVTFKIVEGSGTLTESASTNRTAAAVTRRATQLTVPTDEAGSAIVSAVADEPGWLLIEAFVETGSINTFPKEGNSLGPITITGDPLTPLVASVSLTPTLSEAHLGEPVSLTATALDIGGNPFPGAKVCLLSAGRAQLEYYYPHSQPQRPVKSLCGVADTQGKVTLSFTSKIPGTVGVVAAALHSGRGSVVSAPSHVMFWGQEHP